jgi:release factor glutamine methyltransferase
MPLATPSTTHLRYDTIYEPAEDTYLLLDTLSSASETTFLHQRFSPSRTRTPAPSAASPAPPPQPRTQTRALTTRLNASPSPLILELGPGSGLISAFVAANARAIFGRDDTVALASDVNADACAATIQTVTRALCETNTGGGAWLDAIEADLCSALRPGEVDVLVFNPPYVPTEAVPSLVRRDGDVVAGAGMSRAEKADSLFRQRHALLELAYAGGIDGMEVTERVLGAVRGDGDGVGVLSERGVAYVLLCARNRPADVLGRIRAWGLGEESGGDGREEGKSRWRTEIVGESGGKGGWERLCVVRIWRDGGAEGVERGEGENLVEGGARGGEMT